MSQLFTWGGQRIGVSASASVLPMNIHTDLLQNGLVGSPCSSRDSQESSPTPQFKTSILWCSAFFTVQLSHPYVTTGKTIALTRWTFVGKVMSLLLNMLSRLVTLLLNKVWEDKHHHNKFPLSIIYSLVFLVPKCLRGSSDDVLADSAVHRSPSQVLLGVSHHCASSSYLNPEHQEHLKNMSGTIVVETDL